MPVYNREVETKARVSGFGWAETKVDHITGKVVPRTERISYLRGSEPRDSLSVLASM